MKCMTLLPMLITDLLLECLYYMCPLRNQRSKIAKIKCLQKDQKEKKKVAQFLPKFNHLRK